MSILKMRAFLLLFVVLSISCRERWTRATKAEFYEACTGQAKKDMGLSDEEATTYCDCVFGKMAEKYPHEIDALEHIDILATDTGLLKCKTEAIRKKER
jgi:hypothetical protein